jgi:hypothetical protein
MVVIKILHEIAGFNSIPRLRTECHGIKCKLTIFINVSGQLYSVLLTLPVIHFGFGCSCNFYF